MAKVNLEVKVTEIPKVKKIIAELEQENERLENLIYEILTEIPETYLTGYSDWGDELKRLEQLKAKETWSRYR